MLIIEARILSKMWSNIFAKKVIKCTKCIYFYKKFIKSLFDTQKRFTDISTNRFMKNVILADKICETIQFQTVLIPRPVY